MDPRDYDFHSALRPFLVLFIIALLVAAVGAVAAHASPASRAHYEAVAAAHWNADTTVVWHYCRPDTEGRSLPAWPCRDHPKSVGLAEIGGDELWLRMEWWHQNRPSDRCAVFVHEYGHLLGVKHSDDPRDLMYPRLSALNDDVLECRGFQP